MYFSLFDLLGIFFANYCSKLILTRVINNSQTNFDFCLKPTARICVSSSTLKMKLDKGKPFERVGRKATDPAV